MKSVSDFEPVILNGSQNSVLSFRRNFNSGIREAFKNIHFEIEENSLLYSPACSKR